MLVVGAGPSGLSAAYHLTRLGHAVTIKDAGAEPGGMMRYGVPKYRLPRDIPDAEVYRILDMGVTLELNAKVPAADRGIRRARGGLPGASPRPERRPVRAGERARRDLLRQRDRRRAGPDDRPPRHLRRRDMVPSERTVTVAIGHGKKAARNIDAWLRGGGYTAAGKHQLAGFGGLNTWYYADAPATVRPSLEAARRSTTTFDEVVRGLDESTALFEAHRCMSCATASAATTATASAPTTPSSSSPTVSTRSTTTTARAAACAPRDAPATPSKWNPSRT